MVLRSHQWSRQPCVSAVKQEFHWRQALVPAHWLGLVEEGARTPIFKSGSQVSKSGGSPKATGQEWCMASCLAAPAKNSFLRILNALEDGLMPRHQGKTASRWWVTLQGRKELTHEAEDLIYTREPRQNGWELAHYFNWIFQCAEQVSRFALALLSEELFLSAEGKEKEKPVGSEEGLSEVMQDDKASGLRPRSLTESHVQVGAVGVLGVPSAELRCWVTAPPHRQAHTGQPAAALECEDLQLPLSSCVGIWSVSEQNRGAASP